MGVKGAIAAALMVGTAAHGFTKGMSETSNFSDAFYETTLGDPNIDEAVFGTKVNPLELLPAPGFIPTRMNVMLGRTPKVFPQPLRLAFGIRNGLVNGTVAGDYFRNNQAGFLDMNNPNNYDVDAFRNTPPQVDGSIVFGRYNARYGR